MGRINSVCLLIGIGGCLLALPSCGGSSHSDSGSAGTSGRASATAGSGAASGMSSSDGMSGSGDSSPAGGGFESAGAPAGGSSSHAGGAGDSAGGGAGAGAMGGAPGCIVGAPCTCKKLVGTTTCTKGEAQCDCPPASECENEPGSPCFEPCGGDPFGVWRLDSACFSATQVSIRPGCEPFIAATSMGSQLTLNIADGGELAAYGHEEWSVASQVPLACLGIETVNRCKDATFYSEMSVFGGSSTGAAECQANACGVCDCTGKESSGWASGDHWSRAGTQLTIGSVSLDYCVQGDVLWLGGKDEHGSPKAAYKFAKRSCAGTPIPCAQRTAAQCEVDGSCIAGHCKGQTAAQTGCNQWSEMDCGVTEGCVWETGGCYGEAPTDCSFQNCDMQPGCAWGEPKQHCGGEPEPCCEGIMSELGECGALSSAQCLKAQDCTLAGGVCSGQSICALQKDAAICNALGCNFPAGCKATKCSELSVADCHTVRGCRVEW